MKIVVPVVNNPTFIEIQYNSLKKYLKIDYEFIVFNDCKKFKDYSNFQDDTIYNKIIETCHNLNIKCINIPNDHHKNDGRAGQRHVDSITFIYKYMLQNPDRYFQIDSDMFFIDYIDDNFFNKYDCMIITQCREHVKYIWPNIFYFDITKLKYKDVINWEGITIIGKNGAVNTDTGGATHTFYEKYISNDNDKIFAMHMMSSGVSDGSDYPVNLKEKIKLMDFLKNDLRNENNKFYCELIHSKILHIRAGSNWNHLSKNKHENITLQLKNALTD